MGNKKFGIAVMLLLLALPVQAATIGIAATVNDSVITTTDLNERRDLIMATTNIPPTTENMQHITPRVLQGLIDETLQLQEAKRQSLTVTPEEVEKAIDDLPASHGQHGALKKQMAERGMSVRSLENQVRAQLAWNKVVQRKLKRNVIISKDELARAQQTEANAPGIQEERIAAIIVPITAPAQDAKAQALAKEISTGLATREFTAVAANYATRDDVKLAAPIWVNNSNLPAEVQQSLAALKLGDTSPALRTPNSIQFIKLLERRTTQQLASSTEVLIKQITIEIPAKRDKATATKLADSEQTLRTHPGSCDDAVLSATALPSSAAFAHLTMGNLTADQRSILARLGVGELSEPLIANDKMRLILLCERSEASGTAKDLENLRQQMFSEKLELEAQKALRNLRRDAVIDIREGK